MYLKKIDIKNWKSIENESIDLENLMLLIGGPTTGNQVFFQQYYFFWESETIEKKIREKVEVV